MPKIRVTTRPNLLQIAKLHLYRLFVRNLRKSPLGPTAMPRSNQASFLRVHSQFRRASLQESADLGKWRSRPDGLSFGFSEKGTPPESGTLLDQAPRQLPGFLYRVYVLIAFPLGEYRVIDRTADAKGKLQLAVFQRGSGQPRDGIGEEALLGGNLRQPAIV